MNSSLSPRAGAQPAPPLSGEVLPTGAAPTKPDPSVRPLAPFRLRAWAYIIDWVILGPVIAAVMLPAWVKLAGPDVVRVDGERTTPERGWFEQLASGAAILVLAVLVLLLVYLYRVELMFRSGQTLGKRIMGLRVEPVDQFAKLTRRAAGQRFVTEVVLFVIPGLVIIDLGWHLVSRRRRQCLHDKWPRTLVTKLTS